MLLGTAAKLDWEIWQVDVKTAYLYGDIKEEIYVEPPEGYEVPNELLTSWLSAKHTRRVSVKVWVVGLCSSGGVWDGYSGVNSNREV